MSYKVKPLNAPRLSGTTLRLFTAAAELPVIGALLRRSMLAVAGIPAFRDLPAEDPAIIAPPLPGSGEIEQNPASSADESDAPIARVVPGVEDAAMFATAYREGTSNPEQVAEHFLKAVALGDRSEPPLRAFVSIDADDLRRQALDSARRWRAGCAIGPLDGVPVAVKDELDQAPHPRTVGTRFMATGPVACDATVVARLRASGALLVGKTNMHEVGLGITGINPHHGTARNPHDPGRITGGSSSGSAAAVAAGLCPIAVSADAGGSIRIPAALCGVVGLKPTFGRMSEHGAAPLCWSIAHIGVIGATARDVALSYHAMAGADPLDPNTLRQPPPRLWRLEDGGLRGLVIGVFRPWFEDADAPVVAACDDMLGRLAEAGAQVRQIMIPDLHLVRPVHFVTAAAEWAAAFARQYRRDPRAFGLDVRLVLLLARSLCAGDYVHAQRLRRRICANFTAALEEVDLIATPTTVSIAPLIHADALAAGECDFVTLDRMTRFVTASNLTGLPAISFPAGYDGQGLPIGIQMIGRAWREDVLLRVAAAAEAFVQRRPARVLHRLIGQHFLAERLGPDNSIQPTGAR